MMVSEHKFPLLARNIETGSLVLFSNETEGVILMSTINNNHIGFWSNTWTPVFDENVWKIDFDKPIVIVFENE